jgi:tetratricopeptide (TPR) repeat protein
MDPDEAENTTPQPPDSIDPPDHPSRPAGAPEAHPPRPHGPAAAPPLDPAARARRAGLALATIVFGGAMALVVLRVAVDRIRFGPPQPPTNTAIAPTLPPEWTATPTPTITPTRTPEPTSQITPSPTPEVDPVGLARQQMHAQSYREAVETWTKVIQGAPEDHAAYYERAFSYLRLTRGLRDRDLVIEYSQSALDDVQRALALSPELNGDYFLARAWAFENLGSAAFKRVDRDRLNEIALENTLTGLALPHSDPLAAYAPAGLLLRLGRCDEASQEIDRLEQERGAGLAPDPTLKYYLGMARLCSGLYRQALSALAEARTASADCEYDYQQAVALYSLDRTDEALRALSTLITGCPNYDGYRYYLRALIRYESGDTAGASDDLQQGALGTWDLLGLKAYIEARILADEDKLPEAVGLMQQAEQSFDRTRGPFLDRIQRELADLGGQPLAATPLPSPEATPLPTLPPDRPTPPPVVRVLHNRSSGALELAPGETVMLHFRGPADFTYQEARALAVHLLPPGESAEPVLEMELFDPSLQWWEEFEPSWGANPISDSGRFLDAAGDLFIRLRNPGQERVAIGDVGLELSVIDDDGNRVTWTFLES